MNTFNRRQFLRGTGKAAATVWIAGVTVNAAEASRIQGANDRVILSLVGAGGRGTQLAEMFAERKGCEIGFVCDLHPGRRANAIKSVGSKQAKSPQPLRELNEALSNKSIDGVILATQDHWHALGTVRACQAGKHVYVEKPASHTLWEGRKMVEAARKYNRVVQVGTQGRSAPYSLSAAEYIKSGKLGDVHLVKVSNLKPGTSFKMPANDACPEGFDWDTWLGPTALRPHNSALMNGAWHRYWAYCGGDMADDGVHQLDLARMLMGDPELPASVYCSGGRFAYKDDQEVPDTQVATYNFPTFLMTFENGGCYNYMDKIAMDIRDSDSQFPYWPQCATRIEVYGTKAMMFFGRHGGGWQVFSNAKTPSRPGTLVDQHKGKAGNPWHQDNFIACIKGGKRPNADIEIGHKSAAMVHMANIAHRVGNVRLDFDVAIEKFVGNSAANALLRRHDRPRFVVPDKV